MLDLQYIGCKWPECDCHVPDYAFSMHVRQFYCKKTGIADKRWIEENPGKFDGIAERENKICPKGLARKHCRYNPRLGCDCGYRKPT